jgi:carboxyl-terminal processing protease
VIRGALAAAALALSAAAAAAPAQNALYAETFDRAWTLVRDTHFDPRMNGVDWDRVRDELRPRAVAASSDGELRAVIREMLGRLGLSHFTLLASSADTPEQPLDLSSDPGLDVRAADGRVLVVRVDPDGPAARAGVHPGWLITAVDDVPVGRLFEHLSEAADRIVRIEAWRAVQSRLRGPAASGVLVTFDTGEGPPRAIRLARRPEPGVPVTIGNLPTMHVRVTRTERRTPGGARAGVIGFNVWMPLVDREVQQAVDAYRGADGIVLDLRGNPGGLAAMLMGISGQFLDEPVALGVMKTRDNELRFTSNPRRTSAEGARVTPYAGPLAILVDGMSGSATECFAGGMQSIGRARVFGERTMGQALPALFDRLPNGDVLIHAYGDFVTADGTRLEGHGVVPDEEVPVRREDLLAGVDAPLAAALAWIDGEAKGARRSR